MPLTTCPVCEHAVSTEAAACPQCGHPMQHNPTIQARRKKRVEFAGVGALIQGLAVLIVIAGYLVGHGAGALIGAVIALPIFAVGSAKAEYWQCDHCGNRLSGKRVKICPSCGAQLH